ncbi:hypothetical protein RAM_13380 [Amycolatopsis mediterranei S699]|uniref:Uncharacterized protein n=1 Tax=Amycolatopsis mediterranei (strain S699) TaxID=713604 RepID=A0A9R0NV41_AMYMS|nr:hypothetical protein RAM_13380 [Amycolatopsis mediterranei S699]
MLTGIKTDFDLLCQECADTAAPELLDACVGCFDRAEELAHLGWRGSPEVLLRDRELTGAWTTRSCPVRPLNDRCLAPAPGGWLALTEAGFARIDDEDQWLLGPVVLPEERDVERNDGPERPRGPVLHVSRDGRFAAIVSDYGQLGTDSPLLDGIELREAATGRLTGSFAGPSGRMWAHDGLLYVVAEARLEVWDPAEGARIGLLGGFAPIAHRDGVFAELRNDQLRTWTTPW